MSVGNGWDNDEAEAEAEAAKEATLARKRVGIELHITDKGLALPTERRNPAIVTVSLDLIREAIGLPSTARVLFAEQDMGDRLARTVTLVVESPDVELSTAEGATPPRIDLELLLSKGYRCRACGRVEPEDLEPKPDPEPEPDLGTGEFHGEEGEPIILPPRRTIE